MYGSVYVNVCPGECKLRIYHYILTSSFLLVYAFSITVYSFTILFVPEKDGFWGHGFCVLVAIAWETQICRWCHPYGRRWRITKEPLDESEWGEWKSWLKALKVGFKIMASGHIISWEIGGETVETVSDFIFGGSKIPGDGDCNHEI